MKTVHDFLEKQDSFIRLLAVVDMVLIVMSPKESHGAAYARICDDLNVPPYNLPLVRQEVYRALREAREACEVFG